MWIQTRDGTPGLLALYERHYSAYQYKDGRKRTKCVGPGYYIALTTLAYDAGFIWRKFKSMDHQEGINCAFFRNETSMYPAGDPRRLKSSDLLLEAMDLAFKRWPIERLYTYVKPGALQSVRPFNPGYCFKVCGWQFCGITKARKLHILEYLPPFTVAVA